MEFGFCKIVHWTKPMRKARQSDLHQLTGVRVGVEPAVGEDLGVIKS
jgi:hypothetical protein